MLQKRWKIMTAKMTRILVVSMGDPNTRAAWSGTPYYALKELRERYDALEVVETPKVDWLVDLSGKFARLAGIDIRFELWVRRLYAHIIDRHIERYRPDIIVSIGATYKLSELSSSVPIIHISDALFCTITSYYRNYQGLSDRTRKAGKDSQQKLLGKDTWLLLTSDWAKTEAERSYVVDPNRVLVNPIGANVEGSVQERNAEIENQPLRLLFVGKDWERKGGPELLDIFRIIKRSLPSSQLDIVGCDPPEARFVEGVRIHGFLDKSDPTQLDKLKVLFRDSSFFVMLSIEEAYGLVYCEAAAFGLPSLAMRTGGVPTIIQNKETGLLFEIGSSPQEIASSILELWGDKRSYDNMRKAARKRFEAVLNWAVWGDRLQDKISSITSE